MKMRIDKLLAHAGLGTRSEIKKAMRQGWVTVNGTLEKDSGRIVDPEADAITFNNEEIHYRENVYVMLNKPAGVLSATEDSRDQTVIDLLEPPYDRLQLFPVGRLDKDTEGLLLLTDDGPLAHRLLSPKKKVPKVYHVTLDIPLDASGIRQLEAGIPLEEDFTTSPAQVAVQEHPNEVLLTIYEGRYHQVKRMMAHVGCTVTALKRLSMGSLKLDPALAPGEYRELTEKELESLR